MSSQTPYTPQLYGRNAQLPQWLWQHTDPGGEDFQRSFRSTLDFLRDVSGGLVQSNLAQQNLGAATGLGVGDMDPRLMPVTGVRQEAEKHGMARAMDWIRKFAEGPDGFDRNTYDDLLGQARAHDIPQPENMNPNQLAQEVERRRTDRFLDRFEGMTPAKTVGNLALFESVGIGKSFVDIAREIPFVGDWVSSFETVRGADRYLSELQEYYRTGPADDKGDKIAEALAMGIGYAASAKAVEAGIGYAGAAYSTWKGLEVAAAVRTGLEAAPIATRMTGIAKMALRGGADAWILTGGGDKPLESRALTMLQFAALGGIAKAGGPALGGGLAGGAIGAGAMYSIDQDPEDAAIGFGIGFGAGMGIGTLQAMRAMRTRAKSSFGESEVGTYADYAEKAAYEAMPDAGAGFGPSPISGEYAGPVPPDMGLVRFRPETVWGSGAGFNAEPNAATFGAEPIIPFSPPIAAVDVPGTTGLQVSRVFEPLTTPIERAQIEIQRRVARAQEAGMPLSADAIGDQFQQLLQHDPTYVADPVISNKKIPMRDAKGRFISAKKGAAISKQESILTSPALAEIGQKPAFDDGDVITALQKSAPGQAVVAEISDPQTVVQSLSARGREAMRQEGFDTDLTLYHGTGAQFEQFKPRKNDAVYLTTKPDIATSYTGLLDAAATNAGAGVGANIHAPNIHPVHVRLKNPLIHDFEGEGDWSSASDIVQNAKKAGHDGVILRNIIDVGPTVKMPSIELYRGTLAADYGREEVANMSDKQVYEAMLDNINNPLLEEHWESVQDQYIVFDPENIRSKFWIPEDLKMTELPNGKRVATTGMSNEQYSQLENHGVFKDQLVRTADGVEAVIDESNSEGFSLIKGVNGESSRIVRTDELLTSPHGMAVPHMEEFYSGFREYAHTRMIEESADAGLTYGSGKEVMRREGFDVDRTLYHGTTSDFTEFDPYAAGKPRRNGVWASTDPSISSDYAGDAEGANVRPIYIKKGEYLELNMNEDTNPQFDRARTQGYLGVKSGRNYNVFDPQNVRSKFWAPEGAMERSKLGWESDAMSSQLPRYLDEYYDLNMVPKAVQPQITGYVDKARQQDIMNLLDPQELALSRSIQNDLDEELNALTINDERHVFPTLEDYAASRGFDVEYGVGDEPRITLTHPSGEPQSFSLSHEAIEFLKEFHTTDADLLPGAFGDGISQSAGSLRENGSSGANLTYEGAIDTAEETAKFYERMAGGTGNPPPPPPPSLGGGGNMGSLPPGNNPDVAGAIQRHAKARTTAYLETISRVNSGFQRAWEPTITRIMRLEEMLTDRMQVAGATPFADVYRVAQATNVAANDAVEWGKKFDAATAGISRKHMRRGGGLFEIMEMAPEYQEGVMDMLEWKPAEKAAIGRVRAFWDEAHAYALSKGVRIGRLPQYMPHMRQFFSGQITIDQVPEEMRWMAMEMREGGMNDLETDVSVLVGRYIRGMTQQIHVKPEYEKAVAVWNDGRIPEEIGYPVKQYLHDLYYGRTETGMISLLLRDFVNTAGKPFGIRATSQDIGAATNFLMRMKYVNMLGRAYQFARNIPQPLWTAGEIGVKPTFEEFAKFYTSPKHARETMQMAFDKGWVERNTMAIDQADVFKPIRYNPAEGDPILTPEDLARRGQLKDAVNAIFDLIPGGSSGLNYVLTLPLKPFSGLSHINRAISGRAGYEWAWDGIRKFDSEPSMSEEQLIDYLNPGSTLARRPVVNEFLRLLRIGDREGAASFLGSATADNQGRYGFAETPEKMKGDGGRVISMLGRFSQQILRRFKDGLTQGTPKARARFLAGQAVMVGTLGYVGEKYGMKGLMKYWPSLGIFFGGGPGLQTAVDLATVAGSPGSIIGGNLSYQQQQAITNLGGISPMGFNPYGGTMRDIEGIIAATQGAQPMRSALGTLIVGNPMAGERRSIVAPTNIESWLHGSVPESYPDINGLLQQRQYGSGPIDTLPQVPGMLPPPDAGGGALY